MDLLEVGPRFATYRHELARLAVFDSLPAVTPAGSCTRPSWLTCSPAPATSSPGSRTTPTSPVTPRRCSTHAVLAAEQATRLGAHREAAAQLDRAVAHLDAAGPGPGGRGPRSRRRAVPDHGPARRRAGASTRAVDLLRTGDEPTGLAVALAHHARILWLMARGEESGAAVDEAVDIVTRHPGSAGEVQVLAHRRRVVHARPRDPTSARDRRASDRAGSRTRGRRRADARAERRRVGQLVRGPRRGRAAAGRVPATRPGASTTTSGSRGALVNLGSGAGEIRRYDVARRWLEENRSSAAPATSTTVGTTP